jgi:transposase
MTRITVGVDPGKKVHQAAAYDPAADRPLGQLSFSVDRAGFERFRAFLERLAPELGQVVVGLEATGHYHITLAEFLAELGCAVVLLNPYQAAQFRRSQGKKAKTDRIDARALARFLAVRSPAPAPLPDPTLSGLRALTRLRADLIRDRTMALNRLHGALDLAFPELLGIFRRLASRTTLALLEAYPTAPAVAGAEPEVLAGVLRDASQRQVRPAHIDALVAAARASVAVRRGEAALAIKVRALVRQVVALDREITAVEAAIEADFAALGHRPNDFPVGGVVSLATILAEAGDIARYPSAKQFLAHFGWCPADAQSGQYKDAHPRLSRAGNPYVRRMIWMLAVLAVRHPGPYRAYFDRRTAAGKNKMDTLVAIGRKLLTTIYAILKSRRPYDPLYRHPAAAAALTTA